MSTIDLLIIELNKTKGKRLRVHICSRANNLSIQVGKIASLSDRIKYGKRNQELIDQAKTEAIKLASEAIRFAEKLNTL